MRIPILCAVLISSLILVSNDATAQVSVPKILSARFDGQGKLVVSAKDVTAEGCYFIVNGGLAPRKVKTGITSALITAEDVALNKKRLRTQRKYFCKRRTLYVTVQVICLTSIIGDQTSKPVAVTVPNSNIRG